MEEPKIARKPGRPAHAPGEARTLRLELRVRPVDRASWQASADALGVPLARWAEEQLNHSASRPAKRAKP